VGGGGEKTHESFEVSPAAVPEGLEPVASDDLEAVGGPASASLAVLDEALAKATEATLEGGPEAYVSFKEAVEDAGSHLAEAVEQGLPPQLAAEQDKALKKLTKDYLASLSPEQLQMLAASEGFEHPSLVGLNITEGSTHPLAHWLDPTYGTTAPSKLAIQAKASERFATLAEGQSIGGLSLTDAEAAEEPLAPPPVPDGGWSASPAEVVAASAALHQALADFDPKSMSLTGGDGGLGTLIAAENHLATAECAELGAELTTAKGSAKAAVDKTLQGMSGYHQNQAVAHLVGEAQAVGTLSEAEAKLLKPTEQLGLLRASTAATERAGLTELADERSTQLVKLKGLKAAYSYHKDGLALVEVDTSAGRFALGEFAHYTGAYFDQHSEVLGWANQVSGSQELKSEVGSYTVGGITHQRGELTKQFRAWAKGQKLAGLRKVATSMGLEADGASRAHVQNYIAASWDPSHDKAAIAAAAKAAASKKPTLVPSTKPPPAVPSASTPVPPAPKPSPAATPVPSPLPSSKSFAAKHLQIVEALKAHQAVAADLPARPSAAEVSAWKFGPAQAAHLGGGHTKSIHAAPDGSMWMFKPDKTGGGARAHAEASASEIFSRVGVPSVGVYARQVGGKVGSIQPLVQGASSLSSDPKSWAQADVDNLVRYHVAAWAVGDHDGNASNVIRTPSGGLCPVDQGQAFKFYGQDRLASDYHPNTSYGSVPVFHQAYAAAKSGQLGKGVSIRPEAALPTVKAFERMPDAQYRAILAPVATEGVKHGVHWVGPMRQAAQKRLGKKSVSDAEVSEEFLRTAVERKNGLRASFSEFFTGLGYSAGTKLKKVA
jgi:hypothetical protein